MELKSRQIYILRALAVTEKGVAPEEFLEKLGVSKRTLYYDVEKINDWLKQDGLGKVVISGQFIHAEILDPSVLDQRLRQDTMYFFSVTERRALEIVYIALSSENITIERLMKLSAVSKNTILSDIKEILPCRSPR